MNTQTPRKFTIEEIVQRRKNIEVELRAQKKEMANTARALFAPLAPVTTKAGAMVHAFNTGAAIFEGFMIGVKIMRKLRRFLRK